MVEQEGGGVEGAQPLQGRKCISTTPIGVPIYIWPRAAIPPAQLHLFIIPFLMFLFFFLKFMSVFSFSAFYLFYHSIIILFFLIS